ncbi:MAG: nickel insertion protein, partial [Trueperaceae bacterium]
MAGDERRKPNRVYLDCSAGIAGDMLLGALLDLGASLAYVRAGLERLELSEPWTLETEEVLRAGIRAWRAVVTVSGEAADVAFQETNPGDDRSSAHPSHRHDHGAHDHGAH